MFVSFIQHQKSKKQKTTKKRPKQQQQKNTDNGKNKCAKICVLGTIACWAWSFQGKTWKGQKKRADN